MTCPAVARCAPTAQVIGLFLLHLPGRDTVSRHLQQLRDGDAATLQLVRFAVAGGLSAVVQVLLFALLAPVGSLLANVVSWAVSTMLANDLHRRRTFHAGERVGWFAAQWEGGGLSLLGLLLTSGALALLTSAAPGATVAEQTLLILAVNAAVGLGRFVALRWSFADRGTQPA